MKNMMTEIDFILTSIGIIRAQLREALTEYDISDAQFTKATDYINQMSSSADHLHAYLKSM